MPARSSATRPIPTAARTAAPPIEASATRGTTTSTPTTSAFTWFHSRLAAVPPVTRSSVNGSPAATAGAATCRKAKAAASRTARTRCARRWRNVRPTKAPRAAGSWSGQRSPARYGRKRSPPAPAGAVAASTSSSGRVADAPSASPTSQSSAFPVPAIAPPT